MSHNKQFYFRFIDYVTQQAGFFRFIERSVLFTDLAQNLPVSFKTKPFGHLLFFISILTHIW